MMQNLENEIYKLLNDMVSKQIIPGASVLVRKEGAIACNLQIGYADIQNQKCITGQTVFRLASMTKPITALAIMMLEEQGKLKLLDPVKKYFPSFTHMKVCDKNLVPVCFYADANNIVGQALKSGQINEIKYVEACRDITIFDLLTHSSGLGMGPVSCYLISMLKNTKHTLLERIEQYAQIPLDFQPGTRSGYSPYAAYEILGGIIEKVSEQPLDIFFKNNIFDPLGMESLTFGISSQNRQNLACLYQRKSNLLLEKVEESKTGFVNMGMHYLGYFSGAAGLMGTIQDYEKFSRCLLNKGELYSKRILKKTTVEQMIAKNNTYHLHCGTGNYWGLGVVVFEDRKYNHRFLPNRSFGWSGTFGTHFYVNIEQQIDMVLGVNCNGIGGAASGVSKAVEEVIYENYFDFKKNGK